MGIRYLPGQRLRLEDGSTLDGGPWLSQADTREAVGGTRVLVHSYPGVSDISDDDVQIERLIGLVKTEPQIEEYSAQLFVSGSASVLVLHHHH